MDAFDLRQWDGFNQAGGKAEFPVIIDQIIIDSRHVNSSNALFVALKGEKQDGHDFVQQAAELGAKYALVSEQWTPPFNLKPIFLLKVKSPLSALQEVAKAYRLQLPTKIIGITGTYGKTMVKDLLFQLLSTEKNVCASPGSFNSQIGVALSLLTIQKDQELAIIEAAISKKQEMDILADLIRPDYTILTPIGKKHLATLNDIDTITYETLKLVWATSKTGWVLLPNDIYQQFHLKNNLFSSYIWDRDSKCLPHAIPFSKNSPFASHYQLTFPDSSRYEQQMTNGYSYFLNLINITSKAAWLSGIKAENIKKIFEYYYPEPSRTEIWKSPIGATFINETSCSDPHSIDRAFKHFEHAAPSQRKIFIFGGMKGNISFAQNYYTKIGKTISKAHLRHLLLFGHQPFKTLIDEVKKISPETEILCFKRCEEALNYLQKNLQSQDLILIKGDRKIPFEILPETFNGSSNNNQCIINLAAIKNNLDMIRTKITPETRLMIIIKAFAYGTDDIQLGKFLSAYGVDILGVSYVEEGVALKRAGITLPIFTINAAQYEIAKVVKWELEVGVSDVNFISALAQEAKKSSKCIKVHLHINTGMGRFGCRPEEALNLALLITSSSHLILEGIMTHFACADDPRHDSFTQEQIQCFDSVIEQLKRHCIQAKWTHAANSSGTIRFSLPQYNMVRIGLATYGLYGSDAVKQALDLRLALSLTSRIVGINHCRKGETISYGRNYLIEKENQTIAVLPVGYFDGLHRHYSGKAHVLIHGKKAPMVGSICMDYMMVDITDIPHANIGDKVLIFGEDEYGHYLSPEELAMNGNSIVHELITCLGPRIQRIFIYEEGSQVR
ncbi:bifunctional UDP-N-acetylmuramoyl-tripeptide:D-alanyl-D-alanine ligase/alanine racemase [Candidatus Protochlamydia amoebophila]|uniref:Alanine racemase n=1 Tax=Protochlamydia amoebophila (strain UWE25) TaxID=264201 RepID=Q6MDJ4_PARUW|nr:bifunctional UDP-N-acetylmuramoyl-tripeptide:D-alanyl-D-alanine ligase/alanine racemase [Candidatus Protochlamydia amoebophila]CAF23355.1 unnamed protein product [Candidatus Protochlamydia amoebophila UWE25]